MVSELLEMKIVSSLDLITYNFGKKVANIEPSFLSAKSGFVAQLSIRRRWRRPLNCARLSAYLICKVVLINLLTCYS